jgi:hypothetical protein
MLRALREKGGREKEDEEKDERRRRNDPYGLLFQPVPSAT